MTAEGISAEQHARIEWFAAEMLRLAETGQVRELTGMAYTLWREDQLVLPAVITLWFCQAQETSSPGRVQEVVTAMTLQVAQAPVEMPKTRMVFCELMYALLDGSFTRFRAAWELLAEEDWDTAEEVVGLMLSFIGYFLGWFGGEEET